MADDFWKAVYDKLIDDFELLRIICEDTSNKDLLSWIKPNSRLRVLCGKYMRKGLISDRSGLIRELVNYSKGDNPLRRIILLTWVDNNQPSMNFYKIAGNDDAVRRLANGEFGDLPKIRILSRIDPREGSEKLYENVIKTLEEKQKLEEEKEKAAAEQPVYTVSDAELEAAAHSIKMISAPEKAGEGSSSSFSEVVYEELQKIKAAVEILQDVNRQLKEENKGLRAEKGKNKTEISSYSSKLENAVKESRGLKEELAQLKDANMRLKTQLETAKKEIALKLVPVLSDSEINDLRLRLDEALKENNKLKQVVANRESSLSRLKAENDELHKKSSKVSEQSELVDSLKLRLSELQKKSEKKGSYVVGQIVSKTRFPAEAGEKAGRKCWLLISVTGQIFYIDLADIPASSVVPEEYVFATFEDNRLVSVESLETEKKEVYGYLKSESDKGYLVCDEYGELPVMQEVTEKWIGRPARGVLLSELDNRSAGIYKLEILPNTANINKAELKLPRKNVERSENSAVEKIFNNEKIAVFGGDRVGLGYEKALNQIGFESKWFSGFALLSETSLGGIGKPDLIIVVTKQISHALLRELNAYAEKNRINIVYSTRRGVSSILELAKKVFEKS